MKGSRHHTLYDVKIKPSHIHTFKKEQQSAKSQMPDPKEPEYKRSPPGVSHGRCTSSQQAQLK